MKRRGELKTSSDDESCVSDATPSVYGLFAIPGRRAPFFLTDAHIPARLAAVRWMGESTRNLPFGVGPVILKQALFSLVILSLAASQSAAMTIYSQTQSASTGSTAPVTLTFTGVLPAATDATLSLIAKPGGELFGNNKRLEQLTVDGNTSYKTPSAPNVGWILPVNFNDGFGQLPDPVTIPLADLIGFVADGQIVVSVVKPQFESGAVFDLVLEYTSTVPEPASGLLLTLGLACVALRQRRR